MTAFRCIVDSVAIVAAGYAYIRYIAIPFAVWFNHKNHGTRRERAEIKQYFRWGEIDV